MPLSKTLLRKAEPRQKQEVLSLTL